MFIDVQGHSDDFLNSRLTAQHIETSMNISAKVEWLYLIFHVYDAEIESKLLFYHH